MQLLNHPLIYDNIPENVLLPGFVGSITQIVCIFQYLISGIYIQHIMGESNNFLSEKWPTFNFTKQSTYMGNEVNVATINSELLSSSTGYCL